MEEKTDQDSDVNAIKVQVKTEPPDEDIQDYAEDTMNELLAIYGYNEKVEHGVTQNMQLAPKYRKEERGLRKRLLVAHTQKGDAASECSVSGNVTPVSGSDGPQSAEEEPGSPSSSQDTPEMLEALQDGKCSDRDHITCAWCKSPGFKHYTLNTQTSSKAFCSERCFASCRRAYFKKSKVCSWCRHTRHLQEYICMKDGERRLQFCSSKCMNQYKMDSYYKEGPTLRRKATKATTSSVSKSNGSAPVSPTMQQQSLSERNSPDTASQDASFHDSQPSPSNIPLSGVFQTNSSASQSMMGMPQLRPSGIFGVQTVVPQAMSFRQVVPQMPVVQVVGSGGVPLNLVQGLNQSAVAGSHKSSSRLAQQQWGIQGIQSGASFKKIRPKPQSSSATLPSSTVTSASNSALSSNQKPRHDTPSSTSAAGGSSVLPPVTVMVPHPVFIPIPVPIPIPIPVCKEAYDAALAKVMEKADDTEQEVATTTDYEHHGSKTKKRISDMFTNGSAHLPSSSSTGAFVPYHSHHADVQDHVSNSTDGHSMDAMLSSSLQTSLTIPSSSSSASEALESRLRLQPQRHPSHISTATVEAMHRSINSRMLRHKCLQRSASMDLSFGRYNTLSALTDFLGEKRGFNPLLHGSPSSRDLSADAHGLSTRASHSALPTKGAGELSPSVREALRCHLTRRLSQSALNLTDVGRYPEEDRLRRSQSMSRLQEDSDNGHHHEMEAISSHTSLEKLADTSDSSEHVDPQMCGGSASHLQMDDSTLQPATKRRCLGSPNQID